ESLVSEEEENKSTDQKSEKQAKVPDERDESAATKEEQERDELASPTTPVINRSSRRQDAEEEVEIDVEYRKKRRLRIILIGAGALVACLLLFFLYHRLVHVKVEDFADHPVSEARAWAKENDVEIELDRKSVV